MDWGGIIAGSMAGGARAVGEMADDTMKRRDQEAAQQRAEQVAIKGEERRALLQRENAAYEMDLKLKQTLSDNKRYQEQSDQIDARATQIGSDRDINSAKPLAPSMDQPALDAVRSSLSPEDQEKFYGIKQQKGSGLIADKMTAAREIGADKLVRDDLGKSYTAQAGAEKEATTEARNDRRDLLAETKAETAARQGDARLTIEGRRAEAMVARANSSGGSGGSDKMSQMFSTYVSGDGKQMGVRRNGTSFEIESSSLKFNTAVAKQVEIMERDFKFKKLPEDEKKALATQRVTQQAAEGGGDSPSPVGNKPAVPDAKTEGAMQNVTYKGQVIGQASSAEDAREILARHRSNSAPEPSSSPAVSGRPLYYANQAELKRISSKPKGISTSEANEARNELDARSGEQRMKAF